MKEKLLAILGDVRPDVEFEKEQNLIDDGILDSLDIISIVQEIEDNFGVQIDVEDLEPDNFNSVGAIMNLIKKLQD